MHILIAPNAFKNSIPAAEAASALQLGLKKSRLKHTSECFPIADGGDGTAALITKACGGRFVKQRVQDPLGRLIEARFGLIHKGNTGVIDVASASGLQLLKSEERDVLCASTYGTGQLIRAALKKGVNKILLGVGGSATVDAGCGILEALGIQFMDYRHRPIQATPKNLKRVAFLDDSKLDERARACEFIILCDIRNKLTGDNGAARRYGPQKGATPKQVLQLEQNIHRLAKIVKAYNGKDLEAIEHGGAAGGVVAGLWALLDAKPVNGIHYFMQLSGFEKSVEKADLLITGEGSIDEQTLDGKAPLGAAICAKRAGVPVVAFGGSVLLQAKDLDPYFDSIWSINREPCDLPQALASTKENLLRAGRELGNLIAISRETEGIKNKKTRAYDPGLSQTHKPN